MGETMKQNDLLNIGSLLRVAFQHTIDERLQTLGVT